MVLNSGFNLGLLNKKQYKLNFNEIQEVLTEDRLMLLKIMHKQKYVLGRIPHHVFRDLFKYVEPFEFSTERLLEKDEE